MSLLNRLRCVFKGSFYNRSVAPQMRFASKVQTPTKDDLGQDEPIKYTTSPASKWKAKTSRSGVRGEERLWYEPYVILASVTVFMVYFTILREENDVDLELQKSLYSRISGLEEKQLEIVLDYNLQHGLETNDIIDRLKELRTTKQT